MLCNFSLKNISWNLWHISISEGCSLDCDLVWVPLKAESEPRSWQQVAYLKGGPRKQERGAETVMEEKSIKSMVSSWLPQWGTRTQSLVTLWRLMRNVPHSYSTKGREAGSLTHRFPSPVDWELPQLIFPILLGCPEPRTGWDPSFRKSREADTWNRMPSVCTETCLLQMCRGLRKWGQDHKAMDSTRLRRVDAPSYSIHLLKLDIWVVSFCYYK